jgi:hypothetical protein
MEVKISLAGGKLLSSSSMDNQVATVEPICDGEVLSTCGDPRPHAINKKFAVALQQRTGPARILWCIPVVERQGRYCEEPERN